MPYNYPVLLPLLDELFKVTLIKLLYINHCFVNAFFVLGSQVEANKRMENTISKLHAHITGLLRFAIEESFNKNG